MLESGINKAPAATQPSDALDLLRQETEFRSHQTAQQSYIDWGVSKATELFHKSGNSGKQVDQLATQIETAMKNGDNSTASALAGTAKQVVDADQKALSRESTCDHYGSNLLKTAGLFLPGKYLGYAVSGLAYAAGSAHMADSWSTQGVDALLGAANGVALKGSFQFINSSSMSIAGQAVSLGVASRFSDAAFNRQTYINDAGHYDALAGATRVGKDVVDLGAVTTDILTFYAAKGILGGINARTGGALNASPFWSTVTTGGVFGVTTGGTQEILREQKAGEDLSISKVLTSAALNGVTDMVAAAPGAKMVSTNAARVESARPDSAEKQAVTRTEAGSERPNLNINRNFDGSTAREYQLVDKNLKVADLLRSAPEKFAYAPVREVTADGKLGAQQNLLVQHLDQAVPLNQVLAQQADILATCNPSALPESFAAKHILPSAQEGLWLTQAAGGRLRFTTAPENAQSVELGGDYRTVSEMLSDPDIVSRFRIKHPKTPDIAREMRHFQEPVRKFVDAGFDSIVFQLANRQYLKITDEPWNEEWGHRTVKTANGIWHFDSQIVGEPQRIELPNSYATYFKQRAAKTPVSLETLNRAEDIFNTDGTYELWDKEHTPEELHGRGQFGWEPQENGKPKLVLLDYDAVTYPELVDIKTDGKGSGAEASHMHYLEDWRKGYLD